MATIDLGKIKLVNRGAYNNSTAYTVDDLVQSGGSTYICIQNSTGNAVTNGSYWSVLAQGGTDVSTTITTQGDILYRDGSGLQRLAAGTNGHVLTTGGSGANPSWAAAVGGKVLQVVGASTETNVNSSSTSFVNTGGLPSFSFTPSATSSKVLLIANFGGGEGTGSNAYWTIYRDSSNLGNSSVGFTNMQYSSAHRVAMGAAVYLDSPNTTSAVTYQLRIRVSGDSWNFGEGSSVNLVAMEIGA